MDTKGERSAWVPVCLKDPMDLRRTVSQSHTNTLSQASLDAGSPFFLFLSFPPFSCCLFWSAGGPFPQCCCSHGYRHGDSEWRVEGGGGGLTERERQRCSVRRDRGLCGFREGGSDAEWDGGGVCECVWCGSPITVTGGELGFGQQGCLIFNYFWQLWTQHRYICFMHQYKSVKFGSK